MQNQSHLKAVNVELLVVRGTTIGPQRGIRRITFLRGEQEQVKNSPAFVGTKRWPAQSRPCMNKMKKVRGNLANVLG